MALMKGSKSPFVEKDVHLKDKYYHEAREEYIHLLNSLASYHINVTDEIRSSFKKDIKAHYQSIQEF